MEKIKTREFYTELAAALDHARNLALRAASQEPGELIPWLDVSCSLEDVRPFIHAVREHNHGLFGKGDSDVEQPNGMRLLVVASASAGQLVYRMVSILQEREEMTWYELNKALVAEGFREQLARKVRKQLAAEGFIRVVRDDSHGKIGNAGLRVEWVG